MFHLILIIDKRVTLALQIFLDTFLINEMKAQSKSNGLNYSLSFLIIHMCEPYLESSIHIKKSS